MNIVLLDNQIDVILKALENYAKTTDNKQLLYATYESLLAQKVDNSSDNKIITKYSTNVINL